MNNSLNRANPFWWQMPIDASVGLLAMPAPPNNLTSGLWPQDSSSSTWIPSPEPSPSVSPQGGLLGLLNRGRDQGAASSGTNGGILGSLGQPTQAWDDPWRHTGTPGTWNPSLPVPSGLLPLAPEEAMPPNSSSAQMAQPASLAQAQFQLDSGSEPVPVARKKINAAECNAMHQRDLFHCKMVGLPACYAQAYLRLVNCLDGRQIPPLNY
jgi:hypothetical protein